ncbi:MAG: 3-dehydroquinate synthase [Legionella sp.]|nr:MAG: 3-dehydroquinate synthase [Legionella sp.]
MAKFEALAQVNVSLAEHQYPIIICSNGLQNSELLKQLVPTTQVLIVSNPTIATWYLSTVQAAFQAIQCDVVLIDDGEEHKNQRSLNKIYDVLIDKKHHRDTTLIALGGGVIGDITGFAAATYQRGVSFLQIPTTLLAQVDASVGGKTAINYAQGKNIIGSFYQPKAVLIDINTLRTLPEREFKAGLAEIVKYALLTGGPFLKRLTEVAEEGLTASHPQLPQLIEDCCRIKAQFVESDEKEKGKRALLNLGHTFAHALEAYTNYQQWLHGEAVAIGLYCAAQLSYHLNLIDVALVVQVEQMLNSLGLPHKIPRSIDLYKLKELMSLDKKIKNNHLRFVVIKNPGNCYLDDQITEDCLDKTLISAVEGE